jgi:hypothetical protein
VTQRAIARPYAAPKQCTNAFQFPAEIFLAHPFVSSPLTVIVAFLIVTAEFAGSSSVVPAYFSVTYY